MKIATHPTNSNFEPAEVIDPATLTRELGGKWYRSYGSAPCPICQPERRKGQNALTIGAKAGKLLLHCKKTGCDFRELLTAAGIRPGHLEIDQFALMQAERARLEQAAKLKARARGLWDLGQPLQGTKGEKYLRARGINCPLPDSLRWLPDTYHQPSGTYCSAILADVRPTGGVHRTYFTNKGERLAKSAKMMLGPCSGGAVRLSEAVGPLVICEGVETGLSLLSGLLDYPASVWAALSTSGIKGLSLPAHVDDLIIASDGDDAGQAAAYSLAQTAQGLGWKVSLLPAPDGLDWNDVLQNGEMK